MPSKYHQQFIEKQPTPSPNIKKASDVLLIPGDDSMGQHISPINKSGPKDVFSLWRKEDKFKY